MFLISLSTNYLLCFVTGTYLIQEGKSPMAIDKNTTNHTLEIFSGDVLQFGQGR